MADEKKKRSTVKRPPVKKTKPVKPDDSSESLKELRKHIKAIYSVNGKFKSQLVERKAGEWMCEIWLIDPNGRQRPFLRKLEPFATMEEAIQMAQECFAKLTGDDRYFAREDRWDGNKPE
jgi:hypothetical protein